MTGAPTRRPGGKPANLRRPAGPFRRGTGRFPVAAVLLLGLAWLLVMAGCAGRNQKGHVSGERSRPADVLAEAAAAKTGPGPQFVSIPEGPYGRGRAAVGEAYLSALGLPCRPVIFLSEDQERHDLAVCAEKDGVWSTAPEIFASTRSSAQAAPESP